MLNGKPGQEIKTRRVLIPKFEGKRLVSRQFYKIEHTTIFERVRTICLKCMFLRHEMHTAPAGLLAEPGKYGMMRRKSCGAGGAPTGSAPDGREAAELVRALRVWRKK